MALLLQEIISFHTENNDLLDYVLYFLRLGSTMVCWKINWVPWMSLKLCRVTKCKRFIYTIFATNSNLLISTSLQPDVANLKYFKLWIQLDLKVQVWNIKGLQH